LNVLFLLGARFLFPQRMNQLRWSVAFMHQKTPSSAIVLGLACLSPSLRRQIFHSPSLLRSQTGFPNHCGAAPSFFPTCSLCIVWSDLYSSRCSRWTIFSTYLAGPFWGMVSKCPEFLPSFCFPFLLSFLCLIFSFQIHPFVGKTHGSDFAFFPSFLIFFFTFVGAISCRATPSFRLQLAVTFFPLRPAFFFFQFSLSSCWATMSSGAPFHFRIL